MGEDLVTSCVSQAGKVTAESSWNAGHTNLPMIENFSQLSLLTASHSDGELYCRLRLDNFISGSMFVLSIAMGGGWENIIRTSDELSIS